MSLTLQFVPHAEIQSLPSKKRIKKLLDIAKEDKIVLLEGRLKKEEETELIKKTMEDIDEKFKGIELGVIYPQVDDLGFTEKLKQNLINILMGNRQGFTIIGPATIVKEIKQDPNKIQLFTSDSKKTKKTNK